MNKNYVHIPSTVNYSVEIRDSHPVEKAVSRDPGRDGAGNLDSIQSIGNLPLQDTATSPDTEFQ